MKAYRWIPLDYYHQKPRGCELVIITDGDQIIYDCCWINEFKSKSDGKLYHSGWYHIDGVAPLGITPTHWMKLDLP